MTNSDLNGVKIYYIMKFRKDIDRVRKLFDESNIYNDFQLVWGHVMNLWRTSYAIELQYIPILILSCKSYREFYDYCDYYNSI
jgi:hypothetical protein